MEDIKVKDEGMSIKKLILFFCVFVFLIPVPTIIVEILLGNIGPTSGNVGAFLAQVITYILLIKKLKKDYSLNLKLKFNINSKFYIFIILIWVGYRLTYDNSISILVQKLEPNSWIHEAFEEEFKFPITALLGLWIIAPIFEEIFCRGYVLDKLAKRYSKNTALILSALFFAALHMNLIQGVNTFFLGIILGAIYLKTNSLIPCIFLHFINNTFCIILSIGGFSYIKLAVGICILIICGYMYFKERKSKKFSIEV